MMIYKLEEANFGKIAESTLLSTEMLSNLIIEGKTFYMIIDEEGCCALRTADEIIDRFVKAMFS